MYQLTASSNPGTEKSTAQAIAQTNGIETSFVFRKPFATANVLQSSTRLALTGARCISPPVGARTHI